MSRITSRPAVIIAVLAGASAALLWAFCWCNKRRKRQAEQQRPSGSTAVTIYNPAFTPGYEPDAPIIRQTKRLAEFESKRYQNVC